MRAEEELLKDYFKQYKKPVQEDPTIVSTNYFSKESKELPLKIK